MTTRDSRETEAPPIDILGDLPELAERYRPIVELGSSPLGRVLGVRENATGREGILRTATLASVDAGAIEGQIAEARELVGFEHAHAAPLIELGVGRGGAWVIHGLPSTPSSLLAGTVAKSPGVEPIRSLDRLLGPPASGETADPLPIRDALELSRQLFSTIGALHDHGRGWLVEPAPGDVWVRRGGGRAEALLVDFGVVRAWQRRADLGATGFVVGRLKYTAPELFEARQAGAEDRGTVASDLYALALVAYELSTGRFPIPGNSPASLIAGHLFQPPLDFSVSDPSGRVPQPIRDLLLRALSKAPASRPTMAEAVTILETVWSSLPTTDPLPAEDSRWSIAGGPVTVAEDPVAVTRQISPEELRRAMAAAPPDPGEITDDTISDLLAAAPTTTTRPVRVPPDLSESGDLRSMTADPRSTGQAAAGEPEIGSVTMPMESVEQAKRRAAASIPGSAAPAAEQGGEQVPSVTIPMATVAEAKRRFAETAGLSPEPPAPPVPAVPSSPTAPPEPPVSALTPEPPAPTVAPPLTARPEPPGRTSAPPPTSPPPIARPEPPARTSAPSPPGPAASAAAEPLMRPDAAADLSDLGFGGNSGDALDRARRHADHHAGRHARTRQRRRSGPGAGRFIAVVALALALGVVFSLSYLLSGRGLDLGFGGDSAIPSGPVTDAGSDRGADPADPAAASAPATTEPGSVPETVDVAPTVDLPPGRAKIDAAPWAEIESLVDSAGETVVFSGARTTPKVLELSAGSYRLVLVHPPTGRRETLSLSVESEETIEVRASLTMTIEEFVDAAGW